MSVARSSINQALLTWILILGCLLGGIWGFLSVGRLEDPAFTIKTAVVATTYPGASAAQVAEEVSEPLEAAIQKMSEVETITSINRPGVSIVQVDMFSTFGPEALPAIWNKLRNRVSDMAPGLPEGVGTPVVNDTFGDVLGIFYAVTAPGFSDAEIHDISTFLRRELLSVDGVADVEVAGLPEEVIYVEPSLPLLANQHISPVEIFTAIENTTVVSDGGHINNPQTRAIIRAPDGSDTVSAIAGLTLGVQGEVLNLSDFADVKRSRIAQPSQILRYNGVEAFTLAVAGLSTENIVEVGNRVDAHLAQLEGEIPFGIELHPIYEQHVVVDEASNSFLVNLSMSVSIVVVVLGLFMGWRAAVVVGSTLLLTVIGTLFFMSVLSIEMERISLGALIIAMGMLVDNAIVVAEGMQISMQNGRSSRDAAEEVGGKTQTPLLGATVIGIMAFAGIGLSSDATGEFLFSLFAVIGISLLLSWVLAITVTPLLGHYFFLRGTEKEDGKGAYSGPVFRVYATVLRRALKARWIVVIVLTGITAFCFAGFGQIKQQFFPNSNTPMFFVHYTLPQGTPIARTASDMAVLEDWLGARDEVVSVATFVGEGASRFLLTYDGVKPDPAYGHLIIRTHDLAQIPELRKELDDFGASSFPDGEFRTERMIFGPGGGSPIEARFSGPDPQILRMLANEATAVMGDATDNLLNLRTDWREQEIGLLPVYAEERAQVAGISRDDIAQTMKFATDGVTSGTFRDGERLIPIIVRQSPDVQTRLIDQLVYSNTTGVFVPMEQVLNGFEMDVQNTLIQRRDRVQTITAAGDVPADVTVASVQKEIAAAVEAIELPIGYRLEWGGEFESSSQAQESLGKQLPLSLIVMILISVFLFRRLSQPIVIWLLVPMSVNGVVVGLLGTGLPFSFTALLGLLSLSGMLIKNGIVLVEEIDLVRADGVEFTEAIVQACTSRLRPILLAAVTTILGMVPLLTDAFFESMAVTIMGGLAFATILTLIAAPVFYSLLLLRHEKAV